MGSPCRRSRSGPAAGVSCRKVASQSRKGPAQRAPPRAVAPLAFSLAACPGLNCPPVPDPARRLQAPLPLSVPSETQELPTCLTCPGRVRREEPRPPSPDANSAPFLPNPDSINKMPDVEDSVPLKDAESGSCKLETSGPTWEYQSDPDNRPSRRPAPPCGRVVSAGGRRVFPAPAPSGACGPQLSPTLRLLFWLVFSSSPAVSSLPTGPRPAIEVLPKF